MEKIHITLENGNILTINLLQPNPKQEITKLVNFLYKNREYNKHIEYILGEYPNYRVLPAKKYIADTGNIHYKLRNDNIDLYYTFSEDEIDGEISTDICIDINVQNTETLNNVKLQMKDSEELIPLQQFISILLLSYDKYITDIYNNIEMSTVNILYISEKISFDIHIYTDATTKQLKSIEFISRTGKYNVD